LFELYRAQKAYFNKHKQWASSIDSISDTKISIDNKTLNPVLENHNTGFNITIKSPFSNKTQIIKEDGTIISK